MKIFDVNRLSKAVEEVLPIIDEIYKKAHTDLEFNLELKQRMENLYKDKQYLSTELSTELNKSILNQNAVITKCSNVCDKINKLQTAFLDVNINKKTVHNNDINAEFKLSNVPVRIVRINTKEKELVLKDMNTLKETPIKYGYTTFNLQLYRYLKDKIKDIQLKKEVIEQLFQYMYERIDKSDIFGEVAK